MHMMSRVFGPPVQRPQTIVRRIRYHAVPPTAMRMDNPQQPQSTSEQPPSDPVEKCSKFFKTLLHLSQNGQNEPDAAEKVKHLVESVVNGTLAPEEFTKGLQECLKSKAQPHLVSFLQKTLPDLRNALLQGRQVIEGIRLNLPKNRQIECVNYDEAISTVRSDAPSMTYVQSIPHTAITVAQPIQNVPTLTEPQNGNGIGQPISMMPEHSGQQVVVISATTAENSGITTNPQAVYVDFPSNYQSAAPPAFIPDQMPYSLLNVHVLSSRLADQLSGCEGISSDVILKISEVAEDRLRELLKQLSDVAGHRLEPLRANPMYKQLNDPRKQLRFVEEMEKQSHIRRENIEREALLKLTKAKGKDKDAVQKAKEIQRAAQEENLNREANEAAIAALGGSRGKRLWGNDPMKLPVSNGINIQMHRPKIRRVNTRDLQCILNCREFPGDNLMKVRLAYGLFGSAESSNVPSAS